MAWDSLLIRQFSQKISWVADLEREHWVILIKTLRLLLYNYLACILSACSEPSRMLLVESKIVVRITRSWDSNDSTRWSWFLSPANPTPRDCRWWPREICLKWTIILPGIVYDSITFVEGTSCTIKRLPPPYSGYFLFGRRRQSWASNGSGSGYSSAWKSLIPQSWPNCHNLLSLRIQSPIEHRPDHSLEPRRCPFLLFSKYPIAVKSVAANAQTSSRYGDIIQCWNWKPTYSYQVETKHPMNRKQESRF